MKQGFFCACRREASSGGSQWLRVQTRASGDCEYVVNIFSPFPLSSLPFHRTLEFFPRTLALTAPSCLFALLIVTHSRHSFRAH